MLQVVKLQIAIFAGNMLSDEEKRFIYYWEKNRNKKKRSFRQLALGLPLGVVIVFLIFVNLLSGWFKRAEMMIQAKPSLIFVLLGATLLIVVFFAVF